MTHHLQVIKPELCSGILHHVIFCAVQCESRLLTKHVLNRCDDENIIAYLKAILDQITYLELHTLSSHLQVKYSK